MIDESRAAQLVEALLQCPRDDPERPWTMVAFSEGWLIRRGPFEGYVGQASYVVERESGRLLMFPSAIPPKRIREDYSSVKARGTEVKPGEV